MQRIVEVEKISFEEKEESSLRPQNFNEYIGQKNIKKNLHIAISASKKRGEFLDHILLFGPPGLGKTTLSFVIANEMNTNIKVTSAPMIEKSGDLAAILTNLNKGDILFIDEIHRLGSNIEEILYSAMEDFRLDIIIGSGPAAQTIKVDIEKFTLIGATTRAGMLSNPLRDRFGMTFRMQFYEQGELSKIINLAAKKLNKSIMQDSSDEIAKRSRGTPRIALRLLKRIRDFSEYYDEDSISIDTTLKALNELKVDANGFDELDLAFLDLLVKARGKPLGLSTISASLSEDERTIEDVIEPYLLANNYVERTSKGRIATKKAYDLLGIANNDLF
ncbi:Holliday junction branch migration DNA helicase RuvB [Helicobacter sp. MIT 99-5507]|uniref:Holliday junction branch migration DNA helicase RuvB n=1 Tax=Helicobacter sp. MIT 99-5507 TaxID=152489 RepID=UPI000E1E4A47|nr:Holliday junction branch migration DNA helicase RuvB [Helicobacter sp. MIT 99-5507]RDU57918.1 Holliday junction branch migration DNA helicase RuvB [Helicobacter sp. MIT 99-5507]